MALGKTEIRRTLVLSTILMVAPPRFTLVASTLERLLGHVVRTLILSLTAGFERRRRALTNVSTRTGVIGVDILFWLLT
jgi:hypothetical protein